ncbi:hypothetical protein SFRURICE_011208 [Spodoptera frugiperda]|nr:hypothetical protein SFRURICE_011208 [Spodoptera frugiperda]
MKKNGQETPSFNPLHSRLLHVPLTAGWHLDFTLSPEYFSSVSSSAENSSTQVKLVGNDQIFIQGFKRNAPKRRKQVMKVIATAEDRKSFTAASGESLDQWGMFLLRCCEARDRGR